MKRKKPIRLVATLLLAVVAAASWFFAISSYQENKADIILAIEEISRELALPYHTARLSLEEPTTELPVPVYGIALENINDTWGAARAEGRTHEGVDIFAARGTPVFSATEGYVVRTNIGTRGGRNVMVVGPGGLFYYYAHLDRIADGIERAMPVTQDTVLGFVGNSGNATGTPPHLHFSIYPEMWSGINPYPFLVDRLEQ